LEAARRSVPSLSVVVQRLLAGKYKACLRTDEFKSFRVGLDQLYKNLKGNTSFASMEDWITTSVGILRIVEVMGATVTEFSTAIAESRVRIRTGRFLSGALNVYQYTSPRFTMLPSPVR
jgi:hypothetical protein